MSNSTSDPNPVRASRGAGSAGVGPRIARGVKVRRRAPLGVGDGPKALAKAEKITDANRTYLEPSELKAFFGYMPPTSFWHPYFFIQYFYGCRLSEPALILDTDVVVPVPIKNNTRSGKITIKRLKKTSEDAGYLEWVYEADPRIVACVQTALQWKVTKKITENPFLFASGRQRESEFVGAERLSQLRNIGGWQAVSRFTAHRMFHKVAEAVRLPMNLRHSQALRHTRAAIMLASGAPLEQVQWLLGHSSVRMTNGYLLSAENVKAKLRADKRFSETGLGL